MVPKIIISSITPILFRSWLFCIQILSCSISFDPCLELVWRSKWRTFCIWSSRTKLVLAAHDMPKLKLTLNEPIWRRSSFKPSHPLQKLIKQENNSMWNNQLLTKNLIELTSNSINLQIHFLIAKGCQIFYTTTCILLIVLACSNFNLLNIWCPLSIT